MPTPCLRRLRTVIAISAICAVAVSADAAEPSAVDFDRDVRPILVKHCLECHGPQRSESSLRLDRRDDALRGGDNGAVIVPGKAEQSPLAERIASTDADIRMPPKGEPLPAEAVAIVRRWIEVGAVWPDGLELAADGKTADHWSLTPLVRPAVPAMADSLRLESPLDAFIEASLAEHGLHAVEEADRPTLIRRVTFDLIGLPPNPEEVATFVNDPSPEAYRRLVERLLASPCYGERWARHWMDVAHFAETHGNDQDRPRPNAWPYRDYLIRSFNEDKPYARFVREQVAGDVLYPLDPQATVALGFLSAGPWDESSLMCIVDDTMDKKLAQLLDRDDMVTNVMATFTSTTVHCARCHNHKFDPITQADYYSLQAVFAGVDRVDRDFDVDPTVHQQRHHLAERRRQATLGDPQALLHDAQWQAELVGAEDEFRRGHEVWTPLAAVNVASAGGATATTLPDASVLFSGALPDKDTYTLSFDSALDGVTALRLEVVADPTLPHGGPGRQENGNLHLSEVRISIAPSGGGDAVKVPLSSALADFDQDGWAAASAIDGKPATAWGVYPEVGHDHAVALMLAEPLHVEGTARLTVELEQSHGRSHLIGRLRVSFTRAAPPALARPIDSASASILAIAPADRSPQQQGELARTLLRWRLDRQLSALGPPAAVYCVGNDFKAKNNFHPAAKPRAIHVLRRGDINQPLQEAAPGALACIAGVNARFAVDPAADEGQRRAALADWLVDPQNVLVWRSIVNRIWHYHFDRGIVDTPNDLGHMGGVPSHPAMLDWLATEFRDTGGSLKSLHRLIVNSAAYRRSSRVDADTARVDADNRLLWRMNRTRLDAECVRDAVLQVSGKLDLTMGGPSVKQFVESPGIHVTPNVDYQSYDVDSPGNHRRSVYRFLFRTLPDPLMESWDCPDGSQLAPVRAASVTALQALSLLDNRFIVRQSEHAATRLAASAPGLSEQIRLLFQQALLRDPTPEENQLWQSYATRHGLANACRMMFNINEFVFVN